MKYTFIFTEVNFGSVSIESEHQPTSQEVHEAILNGDAYFNKTEYKDIRLETQLNEKHKQDYER